MTDVVRSPQRLRVLVIDDHDIVQWGFRLMLTRHQWVDAAVRMVGLGQTLFRARERPPAVAFSRRERQVLELIAAGSTNPQIARALCLSTETIKEHASRLYRKLKARNRTDAAQRALRLGLLA